MKIRATNIASRAETADAIDELHECATEIERAMVRLRKTETELTRAMDALKEANGRRD